MSRYQVVSFCIVVALVSFAAAPSVTPPEEYVKAMKSLDTAADGLVKAIGVSDPAEIDKYVIMARSALAVVEKYWTDKDVEDAIESVREASKAISEISVAQHLMSLAPNPLADEGAQVALRNLLAACAACHKAHREEQPDGSFKIR